MSDYQINSTRGQLMLTYLPLYYLSSRVIRSICQADGIEFDNAREAIQAVFRQFHVDTTDEWGIKIWEKELNLPVGDGETLNERRQRVKSQLRGYGTATIKNIKAAAEAYDKGRIDVAVDYSQYTVIRFVDTTGVPTNIEDLKTIVRELVPAHLALSYEQNYFLWQDLDDLNLTWAQIDALNLTWAEWEVYK
jgi:hypothetical protein